MKLEHPSQEWCSTHDAATYIGVGHNSLRTHADEWGVPYYRIGRNLRFRYPELDEWLKAQRSVSVIT